MPLQASAALRVGQVFVRGATAPEVGDRVASYLESLGPSATEGRPQRQLLLLPTAKGKGGWHLLLDSTPDGVDPSLVRALSRAQGVQRPLELLRVQVDGSSLSWQRTASREGTLPDPVRSPELGYGGVALEGPMPLYEDVELAAWRWLAGYKVSPSHRLIGLESIKADPSGREALTFRVKVGEPLSRQSVKVKLPPPSRGPPTPADASLPEGMGAPGQTIDLIHLTGTPEPKRIQRVAKVLLAIQARHRKASPRPFCHLVEEPYLQPVYEVLAARKSPCRKVYRTLLERAKEQKARPGPRLHLPETHGE